VGFTYARPEEVQVQLMTNVAGNTRFEIPPRDPAFRVEATSRAYSRDVLLVSLSPHMHFRGKSFTYEAVYPNGRTETLLSVPHYDFNWQTHYNLAEPKKLPAGTRLHCVAYFDNSEQNLANPDPDRKVTWGDQTWEEMMLGYYEIAFTGEAPPEALFGGGIGGLDVAGGGGGRGGGGGGGRFAAPNLRSAAAQLDANRDGRISRDELPEALRAFFDRLDTDGNGILDADELKPLREFASRGRNNN
jgi:hypothetical protein